MFSKAPSRIKTYREMCPDIALPPKPIITRWCTWLSAAVFYCDNFDSVKKVIDSFDAEDAVSIKKAHLAFTEQVGRDLAYIKSNFSCLILAITKLESQGLTINESSLILGDVRAALEVAAGETGEQIRQKFYDVVWKNPGIPTISKIGKILDGQNNDDFDMLPNLIPLYKYAPLTSCDVERSFSVYKTILTDNRCRITPENLEKHLICNCENRK